MQRILVWLAGWRYDLDGFLVRARREGDPSLRGREDIGFTEEACIAVREPWMARAVDRGYI